jgi:hypothetical protein
LLRDCEQFDVRYVIRLKENWKAKVTHIARGREASTFVPGTDFDELVASGVIRLDGRVVDLDVELGTGNDRITSRLVGVFTEKGYCFYLTNLAPKWLHEPSATCIASGGKSSSTTNSTSLATASIRWLREPGPRCERSSTLRSSRRCWCAC